MVTGSWDDEEDAPAYFNAMWLQANMENEKRNKHHGGSVKGRKYIDRSRLEGAQRLWKDYFCPNPVYKDPYFRRRYRMFPALFSRIQEGVSNFDSYFLQKVDGLGKKGLSREQKMTAAMRQLAYGTSGDLCDEYCRMGASTALECIKKFCNAVIHVFGDEYLRSPTAADLDRLLHKGQKRGFPGMIGSIDCMHWEWKNCPTAWAKNFKGHVSKPTLILEAVASYDLWIWHAFFGMPGSNNDINVLNASTIFNNLYNGRSPDTNYVINGRPYDMAYYLADGIYPKYATFVQTISCPNNPKHYYFAALQECFRKDVERAFGVLQARFAIVRGPGLFWNVDDLASIMKACIIMHNMIVEDEYVEDADEDDQEIGYDVVNQVSGQYDRLDGGTSNQSAPSIECDPRITADFMGRYRAVRNHTKHINLRNDLIEHLWARRGNGN